MISVHIEIDAATLKNLVCEHLEEKLGSSFDPDKVKIEVKSKQNYKSEWEDAQYRAVYRSTETS